MARATVVETVSKTLLLRDDDKFTRRDNAYHPELRSRRGSPVSFEPVHAGPHPPARAASEVLETRFWKPTIVSISAAGSLCLY